MADELVSRRRYISCQGTLFVVFVLAGFMLLSEAYEQFEIVSGNSSETLQRMVLDPTTGSVFVGSINKLYKLSANLAIQVQNTTGPVLDSQLCPPPEFSCGESDKTPTDNVNKMLVMDMARNRLITCGSVFQGVCSELGIDDLSVLRELSVEVVTNTKQGTNVAFIAPGPVGAGNLLYTASSRAMWLRVVPTVAKRSLDLFDTIAGAVIPGNTLSESVPAGSFDINYIYGFTSGHFSYFIATQPKMFRTSDSPLYTKLIRLCQDEDSKQLNSYIELRLVCKDLGGVNYTLAQSAYIARVGTDFPDAGPDEDVLFATFSKDAKSIVCIYPITTINQRFLDRTEDCVKGGTDSTEIDWLGSSECLNSAEVVNGINSTGLNYCHTSDTNTPLGGLRFPIESQTAYSSDVTITAIVAMPHYESTVVIIGDERGHLRKLRVQSSTEALLYEELAVDEGRPAIRNGLMFDKNQTNVYLMTPTKITRVPIESCETMTSCENCLATGGDVGDPYCGWCSLQTRCTRRSECTGGTNYPSTNRWIGQLDKCIRIESVTPPSVPSDAVAQLIRLNVTSLPQLTGDQDDYYECVYADLVPTPIIVETYTEDSSQVSCDTPDIASLLKDGSLSVSLSIRASVSDLLIANTTFGFYKCDAFDSCTACVGNMFTCDWCVYDNQCTGNSSSCNQSGVVGASQSNHPFRGPDYCPRIEKGAAISNPAEQESSILVRVDSLPEADDFECVLKYENQTQTTPAVISGSFLQCMPRQFNYNTAENSVIAAFDIVWNGRLFVLDNPDNVTVELYKCAIKRPDCGKCLMAEPYYNCGWCETTDVCTLQGNCLEADRWMDGTKLCNNPKIETFSPLSGHVAGGTNITIHGYNLGQTTDDIMSITVAGQRCDIVNYMEAERIVCMTGSVMEPLSGFIEIVISRGNTRKRDVVSQLMATSAEQFAFVVPVIASMIPVVGPKAGGSKVTLSGQNLNAGRTREILVAGMMCGIIEPANSSASVSCLTSPSDTLLSDKAVMIFDGVGTAVSPRNFTYKGNPTIVSLDRISTILSGGLNVTVMGTNLDVILTPMMTFNIGTNPPITSMCTVQSNTIMTCTTPNLSEVILLTTGSDSPSVTLPISNYGFILDGVSDNISPKAGLNIYVDPEYFPFSEEGNRKQVDFGERKMLTIMGRYLSLTWREGDVRVLIGEQNCGSVKIKGNNLTCEIPEYTDGVNVADVWVYHGNLKFKVGSIEYLPQQLSLAIIIGAVLLVVTVLFVACIWRRINANERRFKKMEQQRDEMEMRVAQECKDAFAELQITVLTVSSDVEGSGIPFRDYRDYAARILFPDSPGHPVFRQIPVYKENICGIKRDILHKGLVQFSNLISNQTFLTIFVHTLEAQKTLCLKDFSNVASLLIIALHDRLDYLTEMVKALLQENIAHHVMDECPQLLLRRSEAIVEKLVSHWLSIMMYNSLRESMGKPLFHLFYAIKQQVDKGPVDSLTGEARYGLSEMKVIRQQIDFKTLTIYTPGLDVTSEPIQLKVLDCDTISQAKEKILDAIYKTSPFSKRPPRDELDLEWSDRPDGASSVIMLDDDGRGRMDGEWKRMNTLAQYQVPDGATLKLVPAQPNGGSLPNTPARKYGTLQTSQASSASPIVDPERGGIPWHLVKRVDSGSLRKGERDQKMMAEIYLPRLLTTKGILQQFVDELLETIFKCDKYDSEVPLTIKYLFDFFDAQANAQQINNSNITHAWKSNSLQLRFWVNLIINPAILFDINKSDTVDACLSIIGQTLIDSCSVSEQNLTKDSPSNKLLYAKEIPTYKEWVARYYKEISDMPSVSDQDMTAMMAAHTNRYQNEFQPINAVNELYFCYACTYKSEILKSLDEDKEAQKQGLGDKLEDIFRLMADSA